VGASSHATVTTFDKPMVEWQSVVDQASTHPEVLGAAPYVEGQVMLVAGGRSTGALIRGVEPDQESSVSELAEKLEYTDSLDQALKPGEYGIILGADLATYLGALIGDKVMVITPEASVTPVGFVPRIKRFTVTGLFRFGMFQFDRNMAVMHAKDSAKLLKMGDGYSGVRLKLEDTGRAPEVSGQLREMESLDNYYIDDWTRQNANYFMAVKMEKTMMFIILSMIVAVAAFNIVSTLVMMVQDKQADIAILRTQGASPGSIMSIFLVQGTLIGVVGTVVGVIGGVLLASNIDVVVPFIERFTVATLYPAWRASRTDPATALAYE